MVQLGEQRLRLALVDEAVAVLVDLLEPVVHLGAEPRLARGVPLLELVEREVARLVRV